MIALSTSLVSPTPLRVSFQWKYQNKKQGYVNVSLAASDSVWFDDDSWGVFASTDWFEDESSTAFDCRKTEKNKTQINKY